MDFGTLVRSDAIMLAKLWITWDIVVSVLLFLVSGGISRYSIKNRYCGHSEIHSEIVFKKLEKRAQIHFPNQYLKINMAGWWNSWTVKLTLKRKSVEVMVLLKRTSCSRYCLIRLCTLLLAAYVLSSVLSWSWRSTDASFVQHVQLESAPGGSEGTYSSIQRHRRSILAQRSVQISIETFLKHVNLPDICHL